MNKYRQALLNLDCEIRAINSVYVYSKQNEKDIKLLAELVKKEIPKKPYYDGDGYDDGSEICDTWCCPNCGQTFVIEDDADKCNYCPNCGQKIDFGD